MTRGTAKRTSCLALESRPAIGHRTYLSCLAFKATCLESDRISQSHGPQPCSVNMNVMLPAAFPSGQGSRINFISSFII